MKRDIEPSHIASAVLRSRDGTVAGWFIFTGGLDIEMYYRGIMVEPFATLLPFAIGSFFTLPVVSFCLRRSDNHFANIGFVTFFGVLALVAIFRALG